MREEEVSNFGVEFMLIIVLPLAVLLAGAGILTLSFDRSFATWPEMPGIAGSPR